MRILRPNLLALMFVFAAVVVAIRQQSALRAFVGSLAHFRPTCSTLTEVRRPKPPATVFARPPTRLSLFDFAVPGWVTEDSDWPSNDGPPTQTATTHNCTVI